MYDGKSCNAMQCDAMRCMASATEKRWQMRYTLIYLSFSHSRYQKCRSMVKYFIKLITLKSSRREMNRCNVNVLPFTPHWIQLVDLLLFFTFFSISRFNVSVRVRSKARHVICCTSNFAYQNITSVYLMQQLSVHSFKPSKWQNFLIKFSDLIMEVDFMLNVENELKKKIHDTIQSHLIHA